MRLTVILIATDGARARAALSLALAAAALGEPACVYAHEAAVACFAAAPRADDDGAALAAAGLPNRRALLAMAQDAGVALIACQTGLALTGLGLPDLVAGVEAGGMVSLLQTGGRLVCV